MAFFMDISKKKVYNSNPMFHREREKSSSSVSFTPSPENLQFLKILETSRTIEGRWRYCQMCQEDQSHHCHIFFNGKRNAWLEWGEERVTISLKRKNYLVSYYWQIVGEKQMSLDRVELTFILDPPLFSELGSLSIKSRKGKREDFSLANIDHYVISFTPENYQGLPRYKRPLFEDEQTQRAALAKLLANFSLENDK
jgi:hypothetical protein